MRCKFCNVEVDCKTHICPLCHELLTPEDDKEDLSPAFPPKTARAERRRHTHFTATNIYLAASFVIFVASLAVNLGLHQPTKWFLMVGAVLLYGFLTMRNTVMSNNSAWIKAFWQIVMISLILWLAQVVFDDIMTDSYWLLDFALPLIIMISVLTLGIISCAVVHRNKALLYDTLFLSLIGFVPIILFAFGLVHQVLASAICAGFCAVVIACVIIFARKEILAEMERRLHW